VSSRGRDELFDAISREESRLSGLRQKVNAATARLAELHQRLRKAGL
jgi:hypothetical protein